MHSTERQYFYRRLFLLSYKAFQILSFRLKERVATFIIRLNDDSKYRAYCAVFLRS